MISILQCKGSIPLKSNFKLWNIKVAKVHLTWTRIESKTTERYFQNLVTKSDFVECFSKINYYFFSGHRCCRSKRGKRWRKIEVHWSLLRRNSNLRAPNIIKYFWIFSTTSLTLTKMMKRQISLFFNQCCSHLFFLVLLLSSVHLCDCIFEEKTNIP